MPPPLFDVPWNELDAAAVERFLEDAGPGEGLTWEAKGTHLRPDAVKKAVCGLANSLGGYLILGADHNGDEGWSFLGLEFPTDEPGTWLSSVVRDGLKPAPRIDVHAWERGDNRHAAVVAVEPADLRPCMTTNGVVYERTSGQTVPVTDPSVLARLLEQGEQARGRAEAAARFQLSYQVDADPGRNHRSIVQMGVGAAGVPREEMAQRLFRQTFAEGQFLEIVSAQLQVGPFVLAPWRAWVRQSSLETSCLGHDATWGVSPALNGAVGLNYKSGGGFFASRESVRIVQGAWTAATEILTAVGCSGPFYVALRVYPQPGQEVFVERWSEERVPTQPELDSVERELERARGITAWEPEE